MTDSILAALLVVTLAVCVVYATLVRLSEIKRARNRPVLFRGVNRFEPQLPPTYFASRN